MRQLRVLITCETLHGRGGTELYIRDTAVWLLRLGHTPVIYASQPGAVAADIRDLTIPVVDRLEAIGMVPDLILGQHHLPTMTALLRFSDVPAVYVCHDWYGQNAFAPRFPRILGFVAVDAACRDRLVCEDGIEEARVRLIPSSVDLDRFARRPPLPARPARALVFGNYTRESDHLAALRAACATAGIELDAIGGRMNNAADQPEQLLPSYDIVFAKGRAALEALAVGCAVIVYSGVRYLGPMVRAEEVERLLPLNFGIRAMGDALTPDALAARARIELARYDPVDAGRATSLVRASAGQALAMQAMTDLCSEVVAEHDATSLTREPQQEGVAAATYLERLQAQRMLEQQSLRDSPVARLNALLDRYPRIARRSRAILRLMVR